MRPRRVLEHPLGHQLGAAVGIDRRGDEILRKRAEVGVAVDGRGRGEDEVLHAVPDGGLDQRAGLDGVGEVVGQRVGDRFGHHDPGGEMQDRVDPVPLDEAGDERLVAHVALTNTASGGTDVAEPGREVVENDHLLAGIVQLQDHVAADIAGPARDQNRHQPPLSPLEQSTETPSPQFRSIWRDINPPGPKDSFSNRACVPEMDRTLTARCDPCLPSKRPLAWLNDEAHPQSRPPRRRPRHPVSSRHQGDSEGDDDRRRPAGRAACRRRREGGGNRAFHLRHRPEQGRDRGPFRHRLRTRPDPGEPRQERRNSRP